MRDVATFAEISKYVTGGGAAIAPVPAWVIYALAELYTHEVAGDADNPRIVKYWDEAKIALKVSDDETPWCAAFVGAMLARAGVRGSGSGLAASYLNWNAVGPIAQPWFGAIAVLKPRNGHAHVAFCVGADASSVRLLGGNQGDRVSIASFDRDRVDGLRWPVGVPVLGSNILLAPTQTNPTTL